MRLSLDQRLNFFLVLVILVFVVLAACFAIFSDTYIRLAIFIICPLVLFFGFRLATPSDVSDNKIRLTVITTMGAGLFGYLHLRQYFADTLKHKLEPLSASLGDAGLNIRPELLISTVSFDAVSVLLILTTATIFYWVLRPVRTARAMGRPQLALADVLPNVTNFQRLDILKRTLRDRLDHLDYATRWNEANFVALEAEVQILEGQVSRKKTVDLLRGLRINQRTRLFVVLGEPGTGKSVALRQLCRDLLRNNQESDRVPLYINLKEWRANREWTVQDPPTVRDFHNFVFNNLRQFLDFNSQSFLNQTNYQAMLEAGYFFFVLDSFDEIPAVLDHEENSWLIEALSTGIATYVLGGQNSRGVIASRLFRRPKIVQRERSVFEILPFSDERIVRAIRAASENPERLIRIVLTERPDLGSIARNPFLLHLIISHFNQSGDAPRSQAEMFQTFVQSSLSQAKDTYGLPGISDDEVYKICEDIAEAMFNKPQVGLEIGLPDLQAELSVPQLPHVLQFLAQARIGRVAAISGAFSFSHRRFNEYFLVRRLQLPESKIPLDAIQSDSRWRDALVLYAEIADPANAELMAAHAWQYAQRLEKLTLGDDRERFIASRHALRFLVEGFRNRPEIVAPYRSSIARTINAKLASDSDYIEKKTVLEALGLLQVGQATATIRKALRNYPGWISEQAARSARYLPRLSQKLAFAIYDYTTNRAGFAALKQARQQARIFEISDTFKNLSSWLNWYVFDFSKATFALTLTFAVSVATGSFEYTKILSMSVGIVIISSLALFLVEALDLISIPRRARFFSNFANFPSLVATLIFSSVSFRLFMQWLKVKPISLFGSNNPDEATLPNLETLPALFVITICILILIPLRPTFWLRLPRESGERLHVIKIMAIQVAVLVAVGVLNSILPESWRRIFLLAMILPSVILVPFLTWRVLKACAGAIRDRKRLTIFSNSFSPLRSVIAGQFLSLETTYGRRCYVDWLDVEPQEVVPGQTEPADRRLTVYTTMGSVPVVLV